jgi:hypothetical protein
LYPGFWSAGSTISNNPNPLSGDDPVAAPSEGEFGNDTPPPAPPASSGLSSVTANPIDTMAKGTSIDERNDNFEKTAEQTGSAASFDDFLKSIDLGMHLTGPTGIASLIAGEAANALGLNPAGSAFDIKNNSAKAGWNEAYTKALNDAHKMGYSGPQAAQRALDAANKATGGVMNSGAANDLTNRDRLDTPAPPAPDVTAENRRTGFGAQGPNEPTNGAGAKPVSPSYAPSAAASPNPTLGGGVGGVGGNGGGSGGGGGGLNGFGHDNSGNSNASRRGFNQGGTVLKPHHRAAMKENHRVVNQVAQRTGMTMPALVEKAKGGTGEMARRAQLQAKTMQMAHAKKYATGGVATEGEAQPDMQYDPPAEMTQGDTDIVDAKLTPGELVVTKPAAEQYGPDVKEAINDPNLAAQINEIIEEFLGGDDGEEEGTDEDPPAGESDDGSGLGLMDKSGTQPFMRSTSGLGSVTRA